MRRRLEQDGFPRFEMSVLVGITGAAGFAASYLLLAAGVTGMWLRYLLAVAVAYSFFIAVLGVWLRTRSHDYLDLVDLPGGLPKPEDAGGMAPCSGGGGEFGGGGASGTYEAPLQPVMAKDLAGDSSKDSVEGALDAVSGADELAIPLLLLVIAAALLLSASFVIYSAPALFAELLVDGVLSVSLYRRLRGLDAHHWLDTAVKRTVWPFFATAVTFSAVGWALQLLVPGADSIGDVFRL